MKEKTYEQAMQELKALGDKMESGELGLDEMLSTYAEAVKLIEFCSGKLQEAGEKMKVLVQDAEGTMKEIEFHEDDYRG